MIDWKTVTTIVTLMVTILGSAFFSSKDLTTAQDDQTAALLAALTALQSQQEQQMAQHRALVEFSMGQQKKIDRLEKQQSARAAREEILQKCQENPALCGLEGPEVD